MIFFKGCVEATVCLDMDSAGIGPGEVGLVRRFSIKAAVGSFTSWF